MWSGLGCISHDVARALLPAAASQWWGGPPGRGALWARTASSRGWHSGAGVPQGASRPTGASAADQGVRPTISADRPMVCERCGLDGLLNTVLFHFPVERGAADAEQARRLAALSAGGGQRVGDGVALAFGEGNDR